MEKEVKDEGEVKGIHPSHVTRFSDASTFDEICVNCGATDNPLGLRGSGPLGDLVNPCSNPQAE
ncbi:MAG: hypothetical protein PHG66_06625 [Candidatus Colwellbacteria bacterium]|nr:hypothetical protein [Candidatus Colwellbacteria bacterium]